MRATASLAVIAVAAVAASSGVSAIKPDFASVRSLQAAEALAAKGELVKILAFPAEFGGEDIPQNRLFIPPAAATARAQLIGTITRLLKDGSIDKLTVTPEYRGDSFVPSKLHFKAWHSSKPGGFEPTIDIW